MQTKKLLLFTTAIILLAYSFFNLQGETRMTTPEHPNLPESIDGWRLEGTPRQVIADNIFEYMNGAGELYLGYHFKHLSVSEYQGPDQNTITVEPYQMEVSDGVFGLLSMDWSGERVELAADPGGKGIETEIAPPHRALYGKGLLRAWTDDIYIRIMANRESPGVREVILKLGSALTAGRKTSAPPDYLKTIRTTGDSSWKVIPERTAYFYSHLVLNSFFYLSHENILNLGSSTEALILTLKRDVHSLDRDIPGREELKANLLVIRYPDFAEASRALTEFFQAYIPELPREITAEEGGRNQAFFKIEDGWMGYRLAGRHLALALACPDQPSAFEILELPNIK